MPSVIVLRKQVVLVLVLTLLLVLQNAIVSDAFSPNPSPFWFVNTYLQKKSIGRFETSPLDNGFSGIGPCPTFAQRCKINLATLPASIKNIGLSLPNPFGTITLGGAVPQGELSIWLTEIKDVEIGDLQVSGSPISPSRDRIRIFVDGLKLGAQTELEFSGLVIPGVNVGVTTIGVTATLNKASQVRGTNLTLFTFLDAPAGKTFSNALPREVSLESCVMNLDLGININFRSGFPFNGVTNDVINFVVPIVTPILGYVICSIVIEQAFTTVGGQKGIVRDLLDRVFDAVGNLGTLPDPNIGVEEQKLVNILDFDQRQANKFSFKNSSVVTALSQVIEGWLSVGSPSPKVNQVATLLTNPTPGTLILNNLQRLGVSFRIPTPPFYIDIAALNASISGLNTFKAGGFSILQNTTQRDYTFGNRLKLGKIGAVFIADVTVSDNFGYDADGGWIMNRNLGSPTSAKFQLTYNLSATDIDLELWLSLISDVSQLLDYQIGQLLGKSAGDDTAFEQLIQGGKCAAPAIYGFAIPFLDLKLGGIPTPTFKMLPNDAGVKKLVDDVTSLALRILDAGIRFNSADIIQHWARPLINSLVRNFFVSGGLNATCPDYVSTGVHVYPNFLTSTLFATFSQIIRDVVGGNPVQQNEISINELLRIGIEILINTFDFPGSNPAPGNWQFLPDFRGFAGQSFVGNNNRRVSQVQLSFIKLYGIDSVSKLLIETLPGEANGIDLDFAMQSVGVELKSRWTADYTVPLFPGRADYIDESFTVNITLSGLKIRAKPVLNYDLNELYLFKVSEVLNIWCLLPPLVSGQLDISISIDDIRVAVIPVQESLSDPNPLRNALVAWAAENNPNLKNMINYILQSAGNFARRFLTRDLPGISDITFENCIDLPNPFNTFASRILSSLLTSNFTDIALRGLSLQPPVLAPQVLDAQVVTPFFTSPWNLAESFFVPIINDFVSRITQADFKKFMQTLGNSTSRDILSDLFETNLVDGSVGINANFTQILGPNGFPLDIAIENATLLFKQLRLTRLSNLDMSTLRLIKPLAGSKFITETYISIPGTMKFSLSFDIRVPKRFKNPLLSASQFDTETFYIEFDLTNLIIDLQVLTAFDLKKLSEVSIGNFLTLDEETLEFGINYNVVQCFFGLFLKNGLFLPKLYISLDQTAQPILDISPNVIVSAGVEATVLQLVRILFDFYLRDLKDITQGFIRSVINDFILLPNVNNPGLCRPPTKPVVEPSRAIFNFLTNPTVDLINTFTTQYFAGEDGKYTLFNAVLETAFQATTFFKYQPLAKKQTLGVTDLALVYKKQRLGKVNISVSDIKIRGGGTFTELNLLQSRTATSFYNEVELTGPSSIEFVLRYSVDDLFKKPVRDDIRMKFSISNVTLGGLLELQLSIPEIFTVPVGSLTNISQLACVLTAVKKISLSEVKVKFNNFFAEISCADTCNSPLLEPLRSGLSKRTNEFNGIESLAAKIPGIVAVVTSLVNGKSVTDYIDNLLSNARQDCRVALNLAPLLEVINAPPPPTFSVSTILALMIAGVVAGFAILAPLMIPRHYALKDRLLAEHLRAANEEPGATPQSVAKYMAKMEREALPLFFHPAVSIPIKIFMPVVAIVNIVFLALSFLVFEVFSIDANVFLLGNQSNLVSLIPLTIGLLIDNLWNAGSYVLAVGLVILSGLWPIVKNLVILMLLFAPKWFLLPEKRRFIMHVLDVLGKYSFIEGFLVVVVAAGIRFRILVSQVPLLSGIDIPEELLIVNILVTTEGGIVILCVAAMATLALNHLLIWQHDKAAFADARLFKQIDGEEDLMLTSAVEVKHRSSDYVFSTRFISKHHPSNVTMATVQEEQRHHHESVATTGRPIATKTTNGAPPGPHDHFDPKVQNLVILITGGIMIALFIGQLTPFFSFVYDGLLGIGIGLLIENGQKRSFSLMDLGIQIQTLSDGTSLTNFKLFFFQFLWYVSIILAPHIQLALHLVLWMIPFKLSIAQTIFFYAKIAGYWASIEVFAVTVIAATFEIDRLVSFLLDFVVGGSCTAAQPYIEDALGAPDGACMKTTVLVEYGFYITFFAMMGQILFGIVMVRANGIVMRDREDQLERRPHRMWNWIEYLVLRYMFAYGAEHHRPYLNPTSTMLDKALFTALSWTEDPTETSKTVMKETLKVSKTTCRSFCRSLCCCFRGVDTVSLDAPVGHAKPGKWNAAPQPQNPHKHVESGAGKWNAPPSMAVMQQAAQNNNRGISQASSIGGGPSRNMSQASTRSAAPQNAPPVPPPPKSLKVPSRLSASLRFGKAAPIQNASQQSGGGLQPPPGLSKAIVVKSDEQQESTNPVFKREKAFSVDI